MACESARPRRVHKLGRRRIASARMWFSPTAHQRAVPLRCERVLPEREFWNWPRQGIARYVCVLYNCYY